MSNVSLSPTASKTCETCPLKDGNYVTRQVTSEVHGNRVNVMFIAEAPGKTEDDVGRPVVGISGKILRRTVLQLNGSEDEVAYGNIVRCRPVDEASSGRPKDRTPTPKEISSCTPNILRDIQSIQPKYIVLCGRSAAQGLALDPTTKQPIDPKTPISKLRGMDYVIKTPDGIEYPATVTYHFAYVNRNPLSGSVMREDIAKAFLRAKGDLPDYSKRGKPVKILTSVEEVHRFLKFLVTKLTKKDVVCMDYETEGVERINNRLLTIGMSYKEDQGVVIPYQHPESPWNKQEFEQVKALLTKFFTTKKVSFSSIVCHNLKFECAITLDAFGVYLRAFPIEDTMLRAHALNENRKDVLGKAFGLKDLSDEWLGFKGYSDPDILPIVALRNQGRLAEAPLTPLCEYNAMDCYVTKRLYSMQDIMADTEGYKDTLKRLGMSLHGKSSAFAAQMERNGNRVNVDRIKFLMTPQSPIFKRQRGIETELYSLETVKKANQLIISEDRKTQGLDGIWGSRKSDPWAFHINKQKSKMSLYIDVLGLDAEKTKTGRPAIGKGFFEKHKGVLEVDLLAEWSALDKLRGTYIEGIYKLLQQNPDMRDGRIRARYNFHLTATARTSCDSPNMQNVPKGKTEMARAIKGLYVTDPGYVLVCADYSQAEVRWLAEMTGDKNLLSAFSNVAKAQEAYKLNPTTENFLKLMNEGDFHRQTAAQIFGKLPQDVTSEERGAAKAIVFGLIYGMSAFGLSSRLGISYAAAEVYQEKFLSQFPDARKWLSWIEAQGLNKGHVESPIGRRRHLVSHFVLGDDNEYLYSDDKEGKALTDVGRYKRYEDRVCRNAPIQSIASDTNLMACVNITEHILDHKKDWRLVNIVHDSIIAEVPFNEVKEYIEVVDTIMTDPLIFKDFDIEFKVPFKADFTIGPNWGEQINIDILEEYTVICRSCGAKRKEDKWPSNRRCEECGSTKIAIEVSTGPLNTAMKYLDAKYHYSKCLETKKSTVI